MKLEFNAQFQMLGDTPQLKLDKYIFIFHCLTFVLWLEKGALVTPQITRFVLSY